MVFKNLCVLVHWMKVALALKGLSNWPLGQLGSLEKDLFQPLILVLRLRLRELTTHMLIAIECTIDKVQFIRTNCHLLPQGGIRENLFPLLGGATHPADTRWITGGRQRSGTCSSSLNQTLHRSRYCQLERSVAAPLRPSPIEIRA